MKITEGKNDRKDAAATTPAPKFDLEARCNTVGCHAKIELEPADLTRITSVFGIDTVTYKCAECAMTNAIALSDIREELHPLLPKKK